MQAQQQIQATLHALLTSAIALLIHSWSQMLQQSCDSERRLKQASEQRCEALSRDINQCVRRFIRHEFRVSCDNSINSSSFFYRYHNQLAEMQEDKNRAQVALRAEVQISLSAIFTSNVAGIRDTRAPSGAQASSGRSAPG